MIKYDYYINLYKMLLIQGTAICVGFTILVNLTPFEIDEPYRYISTFIGVMCCIAIYILARMLYFRLIVKKVHIVNGTIIALSGSDLKIDIDGIRKKIKTNVKCEDLEDLVEQGKQIKILKYNRLMIPFLGDLKVQKNKQESEHILAIHSITQNSIAF